MDDEKELKIAILEEELAIWKHDLEDAEQLVLDAQKAIAKLEAEISKLKK